jgi:AcrR family transcriptional regulator
VVGRDYRGMSAAERRADRRERLVAAAYTLFADPGFRRTTIERLCATARISNRAFYECFASREDLMRAVYERCVDETLISVNQAIDKASQRRDDRIVAGIGEYVRFVTADPRRARIMHVDVLCGVRQQTITAFTKIIERFVDKLPERLPLDLHLLALASVGAITELLIEWVLTTPPPPAEELVDISVHIFRRTFGAATTDLNGLPRDDYAEPHDPS